VIADRRYTTIHQLVGSVTQRTAAAETLTDKIDRVVTHRVVGVPLFLAVMWLLFKLTTDVTAPLVDGLDRLINGPFAGGVLALLTAVRLDNTWFAGLVIDGIIAGVGGVLIFVPVLMTLYAALALLEDSGYMARAAFVMDGLMARIGLHGKSFLPMMVGFGCNVPAIYATRTLENEKDRILTALLVPFMSCGARLPVYVLFATVFFARQAGAVVFSLYLLGILTAIALGYVLRHTLFHGHETGALLMELPPYRRPAARAIWAHTWERTWAFIQNAWSLILVASVVLWLLMALPAGRGDGRFAATAIDDSVFATVAGAVAPALEPLGFGTWEASGALLSGFVAKEVVVSTIAQTVGAVDSAASGDMRQAVYALFEASSGGHAAAAGLAFMVFVLIYTPCVVALAAERHELGWKWTGFSIFGQLVLAWVMAWAVFNGAVLLGVG
jgi:ferrous iron transport protein B